MDKIPRVDIDDSGIFKYILIKVHDPKDENEDNAFFIVRGYCRASFHADIFDEVQEKLDPLDCECVGGGRISHDPVNKKIHVYGYSQGYGKADHEITAGILKKKYNDCTISISDEGY